ncbi:MAG: 5'-3' exoribonuclease 2 [Peltula sp. TS41687]|nr:MAG: 5'-3' exoribonuclease 2 [Peltula sp. TS41687]
MGVPALFRWLSTKYAKIISPVIEELPQVIDGEDVPVDATRPNPNGEEMDNLYLDMNGIVHPCSHPEDRPPPATEEEMMLEVFKYTERVVNMVRPRKLLMIAVDGVAPRAKMNQQRSRRFRSAQEAKEKDDDKAELIKMLKSKRGDALDESITASVNKVTWDSNVITPGTPFMDILAESLRYWVAYKLNTDPAWAKLKIIISDSTVPGEGEHKIMEFIRSQRSSPEHDPNTRHVIYGLDADLIMLGLATHEPHFRVLREDVFFKQSKGRSCIICGQKGHSSEQCKGEVKVKDGEFDEKDKAHPLKPFIWLHVSILREYLAAELYVPSQPFRFDLERALDDWVFMCFFVGNDFLPHLPSLDIRDNSIDTLIAIWRDNIPHMGGYVTKDGHVDLTRAQLILKGLAKQEDAIFQRRRQGEQRMDANAKRRKLEEQDRRNSRNAPQGASGANEASQASPGNGTPILSAGAKRQRKRKAVADAHVPPDQSLLFAPGNITKEAKDLTHEMVVNRGAIFRANQANKSAAAVLKSRLLGTGSTPEKARENGVEESTVVSTTEVSVVESVSVDEAKASVQKDGTPIQTPTQSSRKRKADDLDEDNAETPGDDIADTPRTQTGADDDLNTDNVRLWEPGYADRYYEQKFGVDRKDKDFRTKVAHAYAEGLAWVLLYYFQGCPSWTWYYPYHYAPFAADFVGLESMEIEFEKGIPFKPFEQLMGVLPATSKHAIPEVFHELMTEEDSEIIDFYPEEFPIDLNGKKFAWQGVALLPFIDEKRLLEAMGKKYPLLSSDDAARNGVGKDVLLLSDGHPLYDEITTNFYSKRQGSPKYKLNPRVSEGLAGKVEKIETQLPRSTLMFPLKNGDMPDLEDDRSIRVHYDMPKVGHIHKSMLLRGVQLPPVALDHGDIETMKSRARKTGRSYGGAPLQGSYGNGRGQGSINYSSQPPVPFNIPPPGTGQTYPGPPGTNAHSYHRGQAPTSMGAPWPPYPAAGYAQGPPMPPPPPGTYGNSGFSYGYTMQAQYQTQYPPPPAPPPSAHGPPHQQYPYQANNGYYGQAPYNNNQRRGSYNAGPPEWNGPGGSAPYNNNGRRY